LNPGDADEIHGVLESTKTMSSRPAAVSPLDLREHLLDVLTGVS
jgi:hypothetical protein